MKVLVAMEYSGVVRDAFLARGHAAVSCDLLPSENPGPHIVGDIREILPKMVGAIDLLVAHPPCTYLSNSGVRWLYGGKGTVRDPERWAAMEDAAELFRLMLEADVPRVAVENPIMHRYGRELVGGGPTQLIQPWQHGHGEVKATGFWLRNLPPLVPTNVVDGREARVHLMSPGPKRGHERSRTLPGIAAAMADQWGVTDRRKSDLDDRRRRILDGTARPWADEPTRGRVD